MIGHCRTELSQRRTVPPASLAALHRSYPACQTCSTSSLVPEFGPENCARDSKGATDLLLDLMIIQHLLNFCSERVESKFLDEK
jgi:hypothetical protein